MVPSSSMAAATLDSGSSTSRRNRHRLTGGSSPLAVKNLLQALDLGGELALETGSDVGLEDQADPRAKRPHRLAGPAHDVHALCPGALHRGEHRVRPVGKTTVPHD